MCILSAQESREWVALTVKERKLFQIYYVVAICCFTLGKNCHSANDIAARLIYEILKR